MSKHNFEKQTRKTQKDSIVEVAKDLIEMDAKHKIPSNYGAKAYSKGNEIWVFFYTPVQFSPKNSIFNYGVSVEIRFKSFAYQTINNSDIPWDGKSIAFYEPSASDSKAINYVLERLGTFEKINLNNFNPQDSLQILEKEDFYELTLITDDVKRNYIVYKDGSIEAFEHRHVKIPSMIEQGFLEID